MSPIDSGSVCPVPNVSKVASCELIVGMPELRVPVRDVTCSGRVIAGRTASIGLDLRDAVPTP